MKKSTKHRAAPLLVATAVLAGLILILGSGPVWANGFIPCIKLEKQVSVAGNMAPWSNADTCTDAPSTAGSAWYRLVITNCGNEILKDLVINDSTLEIHNVMLKDVGIMDGDIAPGETRFITERTIKKLFVSDVCEMGSQIENTASVKGTGISSHQTVEASDPACVKCEELCSIGDYVFEDANGNGCQDGGELGIEGVLVTLIEYSSTDCSGTTVTKTDTTDSAGLYTFTGLDCNKGYIVEFGDAGAIYARTQPNIVACGDALDSDCAVGDGKTECYTFPDPENFPNNPTIDCGYLCKGVIGDYVWRDENSDGCQDEIDTGIAGVDVTLSEGCAVQENPITVQTDVDGFYLFEGLCPGEYFVEFGNDSTNTTPGVRCDPNNAEESDKTDSNCGDLDLQCVTLTPDNAVDETIDCGKLPPDCVLEVDKKCQVEPPVTGPFECKDKIDALKMIWNGPGTLTSVTAYRGKVGEEEIPVSISNDDPPVVTVSGYQPSTNDVQWAWVSNVRVPEYRSFTCPAPTTIWTDRRIAAPRRATARTRPCRPTPTSGGSKAWQPTRALCSTARPNRLRD